jgi:hypothetical protein
MKATSEHAPRNQAQSREIVVAGYVPQSNDCDAVP